MSFTHTFDEEVAEEYGVPSAIVISALQRWIKKNRANESNHHDDRTWTYNSVKAWAELFPFWTDDQVRRVLERLAEKKVVRTGNYNKTGYDRTLWYAFEDEGKWLPFGKSAKSKVVEKPNPVGEKAEPIPPLNHPTPPEDVSSRPAQTKLDALLGTGLVRKITDYYQSLFEEEYPGFKPTWDGKIIKLVKADIARMGDEHLGRLIQLFFEDPGQFVKANGTGMGYNIFHSQIDRLIEKAARAEKRGA